MQNKKLYIGITGGIGSGKSAVTKILREKGYPVIDADLIARKVMTPGHPCYQEVYKTFGGEFFHPTGELDRQKMGQLIFNDESKRILLNDIVHPAIYKEIQEEKKTYQASHHIVFADIPLLIENGRMDEFDAIWLVYTNLDLRIQRIIERDRVDEAFAKAKIESQMSLDEKKNYVDVILMNNESLEALKEKVEKILFTIC